MRTEKGAIAAGAAALLLLVAFAAPSRAAQEAGSEPMPGGQGPAGASTAGPKDAGASAEGEAAGTPEATTATGVPGGQGSAEAPGAKIPIVVEADSLTVDKETKRLTATGDVVVQWGSSRLTSESLCVDERERSVEANGGVTYDSDELTGTADAVHIDVDDETGVFEDVELRLKGEAGHFGAVRMNKLEGRRLHLEDGYFTSCEVTPGRAPDWELRSRQLDVRLDDYARLEHGRLQLRGIPVLYLPYFLFPTKQTRQSGLLAPSFGSSSRRGFLYDQPVYWAIDKQQDVTVTTVVETAARLGLETEYRYEPTHARSGHIDVAYYNEALRGDASSQIDSPLYAGSDIPENRGSLEITHRERLPGVTGYADVQVVSDDLYLREVDSFASEGEPHELRRTRRYTTSRAGFLAGTGFTSGGIEAVGYQDLVGSQDTTPQQPLDAWVRSDGAVGPLVFNVDSSLDWFARSQGADGSRVDMATTVGIPVVLGDRLTSRAWVRGRGTAYVMDDRDQLDSDGNFVRRLDEYPTRGVLEGGADLRTKLARSYALGSPRWSGAYHSLEPFVGYRHLQQTNDDVLPLYDGLDAIDGRDVARYGVESRLLLRPRGGDDEAKERPFELARISLSQTYNLTRQVVDDHFSDVDLAAFVQPFRGLAVRTLTSYNVGATELRGAQASVSFEGGPIWPMRGPSNQIAAAYRYVRGDTTDILESSELFARLGLTPTIALGLRGRYDFISSSFVERGGGLNFSSACKCWNVGIGVVQKVNPDEFQVRFNFELAGLGGFGSPAAKRSSRALQDVAYEDVGFWRAGW